ncbi:MAG TPA: hypothetical protein VL362_03465 [Patescibacteria group bacterium]|jgi:Tfp pilus assembly protein PilN|nr:hypothetical protein [Patescibacteria group bacterium]
MINLLPVEQKRDIRAARANLLLTRYVLLTLGALMVLFVIMAIAWMILNNIRQDAQAKIDASAASSAEMAKDVAAVKDFQTNLSTAKQILGKEVNYSQIILRYAGAIPGSAIIDHIDLDPSIVGTPSTFTAKVRSAQDALALKDSLNKSPYFDNVHFTEIQHNTDAADGLNYTVTVDVTINKTLLQASEVKR